MTLLRRIYDAPELFQLLATFGVTLAVEDLVLLIWGPDELLGPRAPGLQAAPFDLFGQPFPTYDLLLIALAPAMLGLLWLLFRRTRWGVLVRAATHDREMTAALGVNQKWLFTSVFALGVFLAALGGALALPREAANHGMDLSVIAESLVVVVIGGLGSLPGAFLAAVLVAELNAFGILVLPGVSLALAFVVMALVLIVRPWGLLGKPEALARPPAGVATARWRPLSPRGRLALVAALALAAALPGFAGPYLLNVASEVAIFALYAASLHFLVGAAGIVSFGHAAYFGLGAYGAALAVKSLGLGLGGALICGVVLALAGGVVFGAFCVRLTGVHAAMLTLRLRRDRMVGGVSVDRRDRRRQWDHRRLALGLGREPDALLLAVPDRLRPARRPCCARSCSRRSATRCARCATIRRAPRPSASRVSPCRAPVSRSPPALRASPAALFAFLKGGVFPDALGVPLSIDGLVMVLVGGVDSVAGGVVGALVFRTLSIWTVSHTDYSRLVDGALILVLVLAFPRGLVGALAGRFSR